MIDAYDVATIRGLEAEAIAEVGEDTLMQRAASGVAAAVARDVVSLRGRVYGTKIMILIGPGNNGGDALFAGARLARRGAAVTGVRCLGRPHARGFAALRDAGGRLIEIADLDLDENQWPLKPDVAVDGILGIGGRPGLPDRVAALAGALESWLVPTVAVDMPSGVDADTGAVPTSSIRATRTVTFGELKPCHLLEPARSRCGEVQVIDIGLGTLHLPADRWLRQMEEAELTDWPYPDSRSDKYSRGVVGIDAGSDQYPGAGVLSTYGAVHGGAGMVRFLGADKPAEIIRRVLPNVVFSPGQVQAHLLGEERSWVTDDPLRAVREAVQRTGATVLLKGATQLVAGPDTDVMTVPPP